MISKFGIQAALLILALSVSVSSPAGAQCSGTRCGPPIEKPLVLLLAPSSPHTEAVKSEFTTSIFTDARHVKYEVKQYLNDDDMLRVLKSAERSTNVGGVAVLLSGPLKPELMKKILEATPEYPVVVLNLDRPCEDKASAVCTSELGTVNIDARDRFRFAWHQDPRQLGRRGNQYLMQWWLGRK